MPISSSSWRAAATLTWNCIVFGLLTLNSLLSGVLGNALGCPIAPPIAPAASSADATLRGGVDCPTVGLATNSVSLSKFSLLSCSMRSRLTGTNISF
jgi:hypothetical protein